MRALVSFYLPAGQFQKGQGGRSRSRNLSERVKLGYRPSRPPSWTWLDYNLIRPYQLSYSRKSVLIWWNVCLCSDLVCIPITDERPHERGEHEDSVASRAPVSPTFLVPNNRSGVAIRSRPHRNLAAASYSAPGGGMRFSPAACRSRVPDRTLDAGDSHTSDRLECSPIKAM